jgi:hypothetical protein
LLAKLIKLPRGHELVVLDLCGTAEPGKKKAVGGGLPECSFLLIPGADSGPHRVSSAECPASL